MIRVTPIMRQAMLSAARAYAKANKVSMKTTSRRVCGDGRYFATLAKGGSINKYDEVMAFFDDNRNWRNGTIPASVVDPFAALERK